MIARGKKSFESCGPALMPAALVARIPQARHVQRRTPVCESAMAAPHSSAQHNGGGARDAAGGERRVAMITGGKHTPSGTTGVAVFQSPCQYCLLQPILCSSHLASIACSKLYQ